MKKHLWLMILCCLIPVVGLIIVQVMGISLGGWSYLIILLCPLSHIVLMWAMRHGDRESEGHHQSHNPRMVSVQTPAEIPKHVDY